MNRTRTHLISSIFNLINMSNIFNVLRIYGYKIEISKL